jgi:4-amino-4-deoxy-L-arabinose transferase-like glycosyltransferase
MINAPNRNSNFGLARVGRKKMKKSFVYLLLFGICARLFLLVVVNIDLVPQLGNFVYGGDSIGYSQLAANLSNEGVFKFAEGSVTAYRMPGYPILISFLYPISNSWLFLQIIQIILDGFTIFLVYLIAKNITKLHVTAIIVVLFIALNPLLIISSITILPETAVIFLVTVAIFALINFPFAKWSYWAVPVIFCMAIYLKSTILPIATFVCMAYLIYHYFEYRNFIHSIRLGLLFGLIFVLLFAPWVARNYFHFQTFIPLTTSNGSNFYGGNNPQSDGGYISDYPYVIEGMNEVESNELFTKRAIDWIKANPQRFVTLLPLKAARFLWPLSLGTSGNIAVPTYISIGLLIVLIVISIFFLIGSWTLWAAKKYWHLVILLCIPSILLFLSLISFGAARFAFPSYPSIVIIAMIGFENAIFLQRKTL